MSFDEIVEILVNQAPYHVEVFHTSKEIEMTPKFLGDNVKAEMVGTCLVLTIDLSLPGTPSATQKSLVLGTTRGNQKFMHDDFGEICVGLNVYKKRR